MKLPIRSRRSRQAPPVPLERNPEAVYLVSPAAACGSALGGSFAKADAMVTMAVARAMRRVSVMRRSVAYPPREVPQA